MRAQSVSSAVGAIAWHSAMAACSPYDARPRPIRSARASAARPRSIWARSQRLRSCSSSGIGVPSRATRVANRAAWNSMSATSDCASGSRGMRPATMRARRRASAETSGRTHWSPAAGR